MNKNEKNCRRLMNLIDIQWGETVDGEEIIIFDNWKDHDRFEKYFNTTNTRIAFNDEYVLCDNCNKYIHLYNYQYAEGAIFDGFAICTDCLRKDFDLVEAKWLNSTEPVSIRFTDDQMLDQGYQKIHHQPVFFGEKLFEGAIGPNDPIGWINRYQKEGWNTLLVQVEEKQYFSADYNIWGKRKDGGE